MEICKNGDGQLRMKANGGRKRAARARKKEMRESRRQQREKGYDRKKRAKAPRERVIQRLYEMALNVKLAEHGDGIVALLKAP